MSSRPPRQPLLGVDVGTVRIGVAVSDSPTGPFKDAIGGPLWRDPYANDPCLFIDDDGSSDGHGYDHRMYYVATSDFVTFSTPRLIFEDRGYSVIDAHIAFDDRGAFRARHRFSCYRFAERAEAVFLEPCVEFGMLRPTLLTHHVAGE